jgi:hypothetical protein
MKASISIPFFICTFFISVHLHAQPAGWQSQVNRVQSRQFQQMQLQRTMQMRYGYNYKSDYLVNPKYEYFVVLKDSSQLKVKSKIWSDTVKHVNYVVYENKSVSKSDSDRKRNILPSETISIMRFDRTTGSDITGIASDSCWLFKVVKGKINIYSFLSETEIDSEYITAIQVGDGPIEALNEDQLRTLMQDNKKALKFLDKKNYYNAILRYNESE